MRLHHYPNAGQIDDLHEGIRVRSSDERRYACAINRVRRRSSAERQMM
ncbi:MAG TPA: hypothetical protein VI547_15350 [Anaerolineales bacterium]|nr:hypothetical protein [Anaerolineales bacterium]